MIGSLLAPRRAAATVRRVAVGAVFSGLLLGVVVAAPAAAVAAGSTSDAFIRTAHLSPDTPGVDIYVTASGGARPVVIRNVTYGHFSPYLDLAPGTYSVATRLAGSSSATKSLVSWKMTLTAGDAYTAAILGSGSARRGTLLHDDLTPPGPGKARVRLIQAASNAPVADVTANGNVPVADDAKYASATGYVSLPAGTWPLTAVSTGTQPEKVAASISLASGSVTSIVLLNKFDGGLSLISALDSAGSGVTPVSGVNTGGGGLAPAAPSEQAALAGMELAAGVVVVGAVLRRRRRSPACR